jgi:hypothetical protein
MPVPFTPKVLFQTRATMRLASHRENCPLLKPLTAIPYHHIRGSLSEMEQTNK